MLDYTLAFILAATHRQVAKRSVALIPVVSIRAEAYRERRATGDNDGSGHVEAPSQA